MLCNKDRAIPRLLYLFQSFVSNDKKTQQIHILSLFHFWLKLVILKRILLNILINNQEQLIILIENIIKSSIDLSMQVIQSKDFQPNYTVNQDQGKNLIQLGTQSFKSSYQNLSNNSKISSFDKSNYNQRNQKSFIEFKNRLEENYVNACQALLIFFQNTSPQIVKQSKSSIQYPAIQLIKVLDQFSHADEIDIISFGIFDQLITLLAQLLHYQCKSQQKSQNTNKQGIQYCLSGMIGMDEKKSSNIERKECQLSLSRGKIISTISKIIYILFTGENKQIHTITILKLQENHQEIFMDLISRQMTQNKNIKNLTKSNNKRVTRHRTSQSLYEIQNGGKMMSKNTVKRIGSLINQSQYQAQYQTELSKRYSKDSFFSRTCHKFQNSPSNSKSNQNLQEDQKNLQPFQINKFDSILRFSLSNEQSSQFKSKEDQETIIRSSFINFNNKYQYQPRNSKRGQQRGQLVAQMINKILNLQEQNEKLMQELENYHKKYKEVEGQWKQSVRINKKLEKDNKDLNYKISQLINKIGEIQSQLLEQKIKIQKKLQKKIEIIQFHRQEQYKELSEINQTLHKNYQNKIQQFECKQQKRRQKIVIQKERILELQEELKIVEEKNYCFTQQIKHLNEKIIKHIEYIKELELAADASTIEIQVRNSRIEDLKLLLLCESKGINKNPYLNIKNKQISKFNKISSQIDDLKPFTQTQLNGNEKENFDLKNIQWAQLTTQWKKSTLTTQSLNRLYLNPNTKYSGSGVSWFNHSFKAPNFKIHDHLYHSYEKLNSYICFLKHKVDLLTKQNEQYIEKIKSLRDLKCQNNKLLRSLNEHQNYRGQENQIILGCLFQVTQLIQQDKIGKNQVLDISIGSKNFFQRLGKIRHKRKAQQSLHSLRSQRANQKKCEDLKQTLSANDKYMQQQNQYEDQGKENNQIQIRQMIKQKQKQVIKDRIPMDSLWNNIFWSPTFAFYSTL